jgi:hypothetical protein
MIKSIIIKTMEIDNLHERWVAHYSANHKKKNSCLNSKSLSLSLSHTHIQRERNNVMAHQSYYQLKRPHAAIKDLLITNRFGSHFALFELVELGPALQPRAAMNSSNPYTTPFPA